MARTYYHQNSPGVSVTSNTSYQTKLSLPFTPISGSSYVVIASSVAGLDGEVNAEVWWRLQDTTNNITYQEFNNEPDDGNATSADSYFADDIDYSTVVAFTANSNSPITFEIQYRTSNASVGYAYIKNANLTIIELESDELFSYTTSPSTITSATYTNLETLSLTAGDWILIGSCATSINITAPNANNIDINLYDGTTTYLDAINIFNDNDSGASEVPYLGAIKVSPISTTNHFLRARENFTQTLTITNSCLVALKASNFSEVFSTRNDTPATTTATSNQTFVSLTDTPTYTGEYLVLMGSRGTVTDSTTVSYRNRLSEDDVALKTTIWQNIGDNVISGDTYRSDQTYREENTTNDEFNFNYQGVRNLQSGSSTIWAIEYQANAQTAQARAGYIIVLSLDEGTNSQNRTYYSKYANSYTTFVTPPTYETVLSQTFTPTSGSSYALLASSVDAILGGVSATQVWWYTRLRDVTNNITYSEVANAPNDASSGTLQESYGTSMMGLLTADNNSPITLEIQTSTTGSSFPHVTQNVNLTVLELQNDEYSDFTTSTSTTSATYSSVSSVIVPAGDWIIIASCQFNLNALAAANQIGIRVYDGSTEYLVQTEYFDDPSTTNPQDGLAPYIAAFTASVVSDTTYSLQIRENAAATLNVYNAAIIALKQDNFAEVFAAKDETGSTYSSNSMVSKLSLTETPNYTGDYFVIGSWEITTNTADADSLRSKLTRDNISLTPGGGYAISPKDANDDLESLFHSPFDADASFHEGYFGRNILTSGSSTTWDVYHGIEAGGSGTTITTKNASIVVFNLGASIGGPPSYIISGSVETIPTGPTRMIIFANSNYPAVHIRPTFPVII